MATITEVWSQGRKTDKWKVQIRRKGLPVFCVNFNTKDEAIKWAEENEFEYIKNHKKFLEIDRLKLRRQREEKRSKQGG